jgi:hypothetical protein
MVITSLLPFLPHTLLYSGVHLLASQYLPTQHLFSDDGHSCVSHSLAHIRHSKASSYSTTSHSLQSCAVSPLSSLPATLLGPRTSSRLFKGGSCRLESSPVHDNEYTAVTHTINSSTKGHLKAWERMSTNLNSPFTLQKDNLRWMPLQTALVLRFTQPLKPTVKVNVKEFFKTARFSVVKWNEVFFI